MSGNTLKMNTMDANLNISHSVIPGERLAFNEWAFKVLGKVYRDFEDGPYTEWDETTRGIPTGDEGAESSDEM